MTPAGLTEISCQEGTPWDAYVLLHKEGRTKMKKSRFTVEQIIGVLRETQAGATVKEVCAKHNISDQTYYGWKRKYGDMEVDEARRLKGLEEENQRLKRLVADYAVQIQILKEVNAKKW
jgi:putative transposase